MELDNVIKGGHWKALPSAKQKNLTNLRKAQIAALEILKAACQRRLK